MREEGKMLQEVGAGDHLKIASTNSGGVRIFIEEDDKKNIDTALNVLGSSLNGATFLASISLSLSFLIGAWMANNSVFSSELIYGDTRLETMCFIHANYLISTPDTDILVSYIYLVVIRGGDFWSLGLRALYFATPLLLWSFGPIPMFATSIGMVFLLHYFDKNKKQLHRHRSSFKGKKPYEIFEGPSSRKVPIESIVM
ncbi:putative receptor-like protein kinase HSL1-like [Capsicum annuum]|nr:putative receptor-like protein kinase HSL1-like [Capsicum annuum]